MSRKSLLSSPLPWILLGAAVLALAVLRPLYSPRGDAQPVLGQVPDFTLVDAEGNPFGARDLSGRVWVASFFFTSCKSICPALMGSMADLQERTRLLNARDLQLVSFSVDPMTDRPELLRDYRLVHGVNPERWKLLTGEVEPMRELLMQGFRVPMGDPELVGGLIDVAHSGKVVLVDRQGRIRGYHDHDEAGLEEILRSAGRLLRE